MLKLKKKLEKEEEVKDRLEKEIMEKLEKEETFNREVRERYGPQIELKLRKKMNLAVPDYLSRMDSKKDDIVPEPHQSEGSSGQVSGSSVVPKWKHPVMFTTPPKHTRLFGSSPKAPYAPSHNAAVSVASVGRGAPAKAMGYSGPKTSMPFATPGSATSTQPVPSQSGDCMKFLTSMKDKMVELNGHFESRFTQTAKDNILTSLSACGLTVDEQAINRLSLIPEDSFFRNMIQYFPQLKKLDPEAAATNIQTYINSCVNTWDKGSNFAKVKSALPIFKFISFSESANLYYYAKNCVSP